MASTWDTQDLLHVSFTPKHIHGKMHRSELVFFAGGDAVMVSGDNKIQQATKVKYFIDKLIIALVVALLIAVSIFLTSHKTESGPEKKATHGGYHSAPVYASTVSAHVVKATPASTPELSDALCNDLTASSDSPQYPQHFQIQQIKAREEIKALFQKAIASPDLQTRAAALFMRAELQAQLISDEFAAQYPNCDNEPNCRQQVRERTSNARAKDVNELVTMAQDSSDPLLYATAFYACNAWNKVPDGSDRFCQRISALQWAQRDPENGITWMYVAGLAARENRLADLEQAMFRLSKIKTFNEHRVGLLQLRDNFALSKRNVFIQFELSNLSNLLYKQWIFPEYTQIDSYCSVASLNDGNRQQVCNAIAYNLFTDKALLIHNEIGAKIGARSGWPIEKLATFKLEDAALKGLQLLEHPPGKHAEAEKGTPSRNLLKTCQNSFKDTRKLIHAMQYGQIDGLQKRFENQSRSKQELADYFQSFRMGKVPF